MEQAVAADGHAARLGLIFHRAHRFQQAVNQRGHGVAGRLGGKFAFDGPACAAGFQRAFGRQAGARRAGQALDVDARPHAHFHPPFDLERDQRFPHRRPRHAQLQRQVALGRQPGADREFARFDQQPELIGDLAIQAAWLDSLDRHGSRWVATTKR
ncbi:hypothetical protein G6F23_014219 [Rhizopus arrhizus]|nr:hypothetical protein G6F23_014219 [Rhizopus arrhizus]